MLHKAPRGGASPGTSAAVLDFDGTLTDIKREAGPFRERYRKGFAKMIGMGEGPIEPLWAEAEKKILGDPRAGWIIGGKIVAPAFPDPYAFATAAATDVLDALGILLDAGERLKRMDLLFHSAYAGGDVAFREGARDFLLELMARTEVSIVTSSGTASVLRKLGHLALPSSPPVFGNAQKYLVDGAWDALPESFSPQGYGRSVLLRRRKYWDILESVRKGNPHEKILVVGDIYELDLALPQFMGMRVCLASRDDTPAHHIAAANDSARTFEEALRRV
ncbi:MAG: hypothetical protein AB1529_01830 [Candidatus Micrarchaeota archaeon]